MIDINLIRENPEKIKKAASEKGYEVDTDHILTIDSAFKARSQTVQKLREDRNKFAKAASNAVRTASDAVEEERSSYIEKGRELKLGLEKQEHALVALKEELDLELQKIPNPAKEDVKVGKNDKENEVIRTHGAPTKFSFTPKDHLALGELLDIIDVERAAKVSGARFAYLKNEAVLLEFALVQLALTTLIKEGFVPVVPPVLIKTDVMRGMGYMEHGGDEDMFAVSKDNLMLVGTSEHTIVPMHMNDTLESKNLPLRYIGFSSAFRREAGSYGKDTRGIIRVHQFDKVEMVSYVAEGDDDREHEYLLSMEEKLFQMIGIPYQVVKMCTGDLGFPTARKYDIEAWIPSQNTYREVTSASTITDFQSRRLNIKYTDGKQKKYAQVLNGTAFAIGRTIVAILENYQQTDGSVVIPEVLQKYVGKDIIKPQRT